MALYRAVALAAVVCLLHAASGHAFPTILPAAAAAADAAQSQATVGPVVIAAAGASGVYRTTDGWKTGEKVLDAEVNRLAFVGSVGYAAGDGIYRTTDAGATWTPVHSGKGVYFLALSACSATHAVASAVILNGTSGILGATLATTVDGTTWQLGPLSHTSGYIDLQPVASNSSVTVGVVSDLGATNGQLFSLGMSHDCGASWTYTFNFTREALPPNMFLQNAFDFSAFFRTPTDGVLTGWFSEVPIPASAHAESCSLQSETKTQVPFGTVANKTTGSGVLFVTKDGGKSISDVAPPVLPITLESSCGTTIYGAEFTGSDLYVAGGSFFFLSTQGFVLRSKDGGSTFEPVFQTNATDLHRISFGPSGKYGCAAGMHRTSDVSLRNATLACSSDSGDSWAVVGEVPFPPVGSSNSGLWADVDVVVLS